jgi:hypothetical protein
VVDGYLRSYLESLRTVFLLTVPVSALAFLLSWLLPQVPLRTTASASDLGEGYGMPTARSSAEELERALAVLASREDAARVYGWIAERADTGVGPGATWLLGWLGHNGATSVANLPSPRMTTPERVLAWGEELRRAGYVTRDGMLELTTSGQAVLDRVAAAREEGLRKLLNGWQPELHPELLQRLRELAEELLGAEPSPATRS